MTPSWLKQIEIIHKSWQREKTINWILKTVLNWILEPYWHSQQKLSRRLFFSMGYQLDQVWSSFILLQYWWECKLVQPLWKTVWRFLKKLKIELPYDPPVPLLGIYPEKTLIWKDPCTLMLIATLFTIAKIWKQLKCLSTDEWIRKMWYIYIIYISTHIHTMKY